MKDTNRESFFQPIISTLGLASALIGSLLPIIGRSSVRVYFIRPELSIPSSIVAFLIGITSFWLISRYFRFINIPFGKVIDRGKGYPEPRKYITNSLLILLFLFLDLILFVLFFYISFNKSFASSIFWGLAQSFFYIIFFIFLISIFAFLITSTMDLFKYQEQRENFPIILFNTLEKNRLIHPGIAIYENRPIFGDELIKEGLPGIFSARRVRFITVPHEEEIIEVIVSNDGIEILKVLKKEPFNKKTK